MSVQKRKFRQYVNCFMIRLNLSSGEEILLNPSPNRKFRGLRIPGSVLSEAIRESYTISQHVYQHDLLVITLRQFRFVHATRVIISELNNWLRLQILLSGSIENELPSGQRELLDTGQYQLTEQAAYATQFPGNNAVILMTFHLSPELLNSLGSPERLVPTSPQALPPDVLDMVFEILKAPFLERFRDFYFANKVRDILFRHVAAAPVMLPGELSAKQVAQMYEADRIMADNLDGSITIPQLARQLGTNFVTLKRNYEKVFGIGLFPRLMQRKMDHIKLLLENTDKPLKDIADLAGYQTLPGFITAFRKRFKITPNDWRKQRRG
ncbi:MAG: AraC family transcriptional regulator [Chitinophagaceae bacterium]|nr:MAG: AraC family transcriptional regulator [Chitinophagaceae bacterium]